MGGIGSLLLDVVAGILAAAAIWMAQAVWRFVRDRILASSEALKPFSGPGINDPGRRRGVTAMTIGIFFLIGSATWRFVLGPRIAPLLIDEGAVSLLVHNHRWITYEPLNYVPDGNAVLGLDHVARELSWIGDAGFTGIVTFTSNGDFASIPRLAKEEGLAVIMGVFDPSDRRERAAAIAQKRYVDGYSVGHNGLGQLYSFPTLARATRYVRFATGRPVTTTEELREYADDARLFNVSDWVFPDAHVPIRAGDTLGSTGFSADALEDASLVISMSNTIGGNPSRGNKPVLLKMVTYPMSGIARASLEEQARFFELILETRRDPQSPWHSAVSVAIHSAFDTPWKRGWPFYDWDPHTGLFSEDGTSRPAVHSILGRLR